MAQDPSQEPPSADLASILGRIPSGIFILTAKNGEQETGMLASWVMQAGFDPPMVSVAVKKGRYLADWLADGRPFVLNVVPEGQTKTLQHFGRGFASDEPAFDGIDVQRSEHDIPVLATALGHLECEPASCIDSGDHHIYLARVTGGQLAGEDKPMVHVRKNGLHY